MHTNTVATSTASQQPEQSVRRLWDESSQADGGSVGRIAVSLAGMPLLTYQRDSVLKNYAKAFYDELMQCNPTGCESYQAVSYKDLSAAVRKVELNGQQFAIDPELVWCEPLWGGASPMHGGSGVVVGVRVMRRRGRSIQQWGEELDMSALVGGELKMAQAEFFTTGA